MNGKQLLDALSALSPDVLAREVVYWDGRAEDYVCVTDVDIARMNDAITLD